MCEVMAVTARPENMHRGWRDKRVQKCVKKGASLGLKASSLMNGVFAGANFPFLSFSMQFHFALHESNRSRVVALAFSRHLARV